MTKRIGRVMLAFDKAFPWTRLLAVGAFLWICTAFSFIDGLAAELLCLDGHSAHDTAAMMVGFLAPLFFTILHGFVLFIRYLLVPSEEVPGNE